MSDIDQGAKSGGVSFEEITAQAAAAKAQKERNDAPGLNAASLEAVFDVPVRVSVVLGTSRIEISDLMKLDIGSVVELDRKVGESIDIYVSNRLVARGEVVLVEDKLGVTLTEIIKSER